MSYKCIQCGKAFIHKHHLLRHLREHNGPSYPCESCMKSFNRKSNLTRHLKLMHNGNKQESPSKRKICEEVKPNQECTSKQKLCNTSNETEEMVGKNYQNCVDHGKYCKYCERYQPKLCFSNEEICNKCLLKRRIIKTVEDVIDNITILY